MIVTIAEKNIPSLPPGLFAGRPEKLVVVDTGNYYPRQRDGGIDAIEAGRDLEREIVALLEAEKIGLLVWSPLAGGLLSGKFGPMNQKPENSRRSEFDFPIVNKERTWRILDAMSPMAQAHKCSAARISLAWLLTIPVVTSVIIGAKRLDQLEDNLAAIDLKLGEEEIKQLDEVSALPPEYPGWMVEWQGRGRLGVEPVPFWKS